MSAQNYVFHDNQWTILRKILQNIYDIVTGTLPVPVTPSGGSPVTTGATVTIAVTGTAVIAIAANQKGYISAAQGNSGNSLFVGGSNVTNSGAFRGLEVSPLGLTPLLTGPVYVNGTAGDVAGVVLV